MNMPMTYSDRAFMDYRQIQPSEVKGQHNADTAYHKRYLWSQIASRFVFDLPEYWEADWFRYWLYQWGSIAMIYTDEYGWMVLPYGVTKLNPYYHPAVINCTNPSLNGTKTGVVGVNAEIIYLMDDFMGLVDLVDRYATKLAEVDKAISINLMNSNTTLLFVAEDKKQAEAIKTAYAEASTGKPFVAIGKGSGLTNEGLKPLIANVGNLYIADKLQDLKRDITNEFLTKIGINNANVDKKERLVTDEVNANNGEVQTVVAVMLENLQKCLDKCNKISGLNLAVHLREEDEVNGENDLIRDVSI